MKKLINCIECKRLFWAKAQKDKVSRKIYMDIRDQFCQTCKNVMRMKEQKRKGRVRAVPEGLEKQIQMRELAMAESERRRVEDEGKRRLGDKIRERREKEIDKQLRKRRKKPVKGIIKWGSQGGEVNNES